MALVRGNDSSTIREGNGGDPQIGLGEWRPPAIEGYSQRRVSTGGLIVERKNKQIWQQQLLDPFE